MTDTPATYFMLVHANDVERAHQELEKNVPGIGASLIMQSHEFRGQPIVAIGASDAGILEKFHNIAACENLSYLFEREGMAPEKVSEMIEKNAPAMESMLELSALTPAYEKTQSALIALAKKRPGRGKELNGDHFHIVPINEGGVVSRNHLAIERIDSRTTLEALIKALKAAGLEPQKDFAAFPEKSALCTTDLIIKKDGFQRDASLADRIEKHVAKVTPSQKHAEGLRPATESGWMTYDQHRRDRSKDGGQEKS